MAESIYMSDDGKIFKLQGCVSYYSIEELLSVNCNSATKCLTCNNKNIQIIDLGDIPQCFDCCVNSEFIGSFIDEMDVYKIVSYCADVSDEIIIINKYTNTVTIGDVPYRASSRKGGFNNIFWYGEGKINVFRCDDHSKCSEP
jgi:hypothetical protein